MKSKSTWKFQTYIETYNYKLVGDKNYLNKISNFIIKRIKYCQNIEWQKNKRSKDNVEQLIEDKFKVIKISQIIIFIYYVILLFNMVIFAGYNSINSYN